MRRSTILIPFCLGGICVGFACQSGANPEASGVDAGADTRAKADAAIVDDASATLPDTTSCSCGARECGFDDCGKPCGKKCERASVCVDGACSTKGCPANQHDCSGVCSDLITDVANCGFCDSRCPTDPHGKSTCVAAECGIECAPGYRSCGGKCALCPESATATACNGNRCVASACSGKQKACGGQCSTCDPHADEVQCSGEECIARSCQAGFAWCDGTCKCSDRDLGTATGEFQGSAGKDCRRAAGNSCGTVPAAGVIARFTAASAGRYAVTTTKNLSTGSRFALEILGDCADDSLLGRCAGNTEGYGREISLRANQSIRAWLHAETAVAAPAPYTFNVRGPLRDVAPEVVYSTSYADRSRRLTTSQPLVIPFTVQSNRFAGDIDVALSMQFADATVEFALEHEGASDSVRWSTAALSRGAVTDTIDHFQWVETKGNWKLTLTASDYGAHSADVLLTGPITVTVNGPTW